MLAIYITVIIKTTVTKMTNNYKLSYVQNQMSFPALNDDNKIIKIDFADSNW